MEFEHISESDKVTINRNRLHSIFFPVSSWRALLEFPAPACGSAKIYKDNYVVNYPDMPWIHFSPHPTRPHPALHTVHGQRRMGRTGSQYAFCISLRFCRVHRNNKRPVVRICSISITIPRQDDEWLDSPVLLLTFQFHSLDCIRCVLYSI